MTSAAAIPNASLNDENTIPVLGIGVGELTEEQTEHAVASALEIGVRLIDTAAAYGNEAAVGRAVAASGIPRAEIFVSTKLATEDQGRRDGGLLDRQGSQPDFLRVPLAQQPGSPLAATRKPAATASASRRPGPEAPVRPATTRTIRSCRTPGP